MENLNEKTESKIPNNSVQSTAKQPYEPPKATFVPLKLEERLMGCYTELNKASLPSCDTYYKAGDVS